METSLIIPEKPGYLKKFEAANDEFKGGVPSGIALPFLSIRGQMFRVRKGGQEVSLGRDVYAVIVAARPSVSKRYYEGPYSGAGDAPRCSSTDGVTPDVSNPISPSCASCPLNAWGSRITPAGKKAKECQDYKRLIVGLAPNEGRIYPVVFDVPATSLKAPRGQANKVMMYGDYISALSKHGIAAFSVLTKLGFTGAEYPQVCFDFVRYLTEEELKQVMDLREDNEDVKEALSGGEVAPVISIPEPEPPKPEPPKQEPPKQEPPKQEPPKQEPPKQEPQPVPADDADLLAEINKFLEE
jgi:hypothetical protein